MDVEDGESVAGVDVGIELVPVGRTTGPVARPIVALLLCCTPMYCAHNIVNMWP